MIIGIDGNEANVEKKVGISEYAYELLRQFKKNASADITFIIYLKNNPRQEMPKESDFWHYRIVGPSKFWTQFGLPFDLVTHRPSPDVFFSPTHYAPRYSPMPSVISVMDLSFLRFPQLFKKSDLYQLVHWTKYSVKRAKRILTISNSSRNDIIKEYKVSEEKVVVTYPGVKFEKGIENDALSMKEIKEKYKISGKYVLYVGTLQPRKNIVRLIEAFSKLSENHKDLSLVLIGKRGWLYEDILQAPALYGVSDRVFFLEFVSNDDLILFYKHALCFVLPSLYEGFGLPILEAMKYDCPVIASNVSSLPEVGGNAAVYIDPLNVDDIAAKMISVVSNKKLREDMIEKGRKQVEKFSWEKTAKQTLDVLTQVAGGIT